MARPIKTGIDYFSMDSNWVYDEKVLLLKEDFGNTGFWVWSCLLSKIYSEKGYYIDFSNKDNVVIFAKRVCSEQVNLVKEIINGCIRRGLFDSAVSNMFNVLTSKRIQENYLFATNDRRNHGTIINLIEEFILIDIKKFQNVKIVKRYSPEKPEFISKKAGEVLSYNEQLSYSPEKPSYSSEKLSYSTEKVHILDYTILNDNKIKNSVCVNNNFVNTKSEREDKQTHSLNKYIQEKHKGLLSIPEQMSSEECEKLLKEFPKAIIRKAIEDLDSKRKDNYTKVYNTLRNYCKNAKYPNGAIIVASPLIPNATPPVGDARSPYKIIRCDDVCSVKRVIEAEEHVLKAITANIN